MQPSKVQPRRIAALVRVSTDEQAEEGYSLDTQIERIQEYVQQSWGMRVLPDDIFIEDGISGRTSVIKKRPGLARILELCRAGQYSHVIVAKLDRFGRNVGLMSRALEDMSEAHVTFISVYDKIDLSTASGRLYLAIFAAIAQWYSDNLSEEVKKGHEGRRRVGRINGAPAYGTVKDEQGNLVADNRPLTLRDGQESNAYEGMIHIIRFTADGWSSVAIVRWMNAQGYHTNSTQNTFGRMAVRRIRSNRVYLGEIPDGHGGWIKGAHEPLVDVELFEKAQRAVDRNQRNPQTIKRSAKVHALGGGILRCAACVETGKISTWQARFKIHDGYACGNREEHSACTERWVRSDDLEYQVQLLLEQICLAIPDQGELLNLYHSTFQPSESVKDYKALIQRLKAQFAATKDMYEMGDITRDEYMSKRQQHITDVAMAEYEQEHAVSPQRLLDLSAYVADASMAWKDAEPEERRDLARLFFDRIWLRAKTIVGIEPTPDFAPLFSLLTDGVIFGSLAARVSTLDITSAYRRGRRGRSTLFRQDQSRP